jgi:hypothetical protein|tara:strand:- start:337 stop:603 length:267 start_codon:yes stop_codon:yes gene_type:complete
MKFKNYKYFLNKKFKNWDPNLFDWNNSSINLFMHCEKYKHMWEEDFRHYLIISQLEGRSMQNWKKNFLNDLNEIKLIKKRIKGRGIFI